MELPTHQSSTPSSDAETTKQTDFIDIQGSLHSSLVELSTVPFPTSPEKIIKDLQDLRPTFILNATQAEIDVNTEKSQVFFSSITDNYEFFASANLDSLLTYGFDDEHKSHPDQYQSSEAESRWRKTPKRLNNSGPVFAPSILKLPLESAYLIDRNSSRALDLSRFMYNLAEQFKTDKNNQIALVFMDNRARFKPEADNLFGAFDSETNEIQINPPSTLTHLIALFHEIGHSLDLADSDERSSGYQFEYVGSSRGSRGENLRLVDKVRGERGAWATGSWLFNRLKKAGLITYSDTELTEITQVMLGTYESQTENVSGKLTTGTFFTQEQRAAQRRESMHPSLGTVLKRIRGRFLGI